MITYGGPTYYDGNWNTLAAQASAYGNANLFQGLQADSATGLLYARGRWYSASQGRWAQQDPLGWPDGVNRYGYLGSLPTARVDPYGTKWYKGWGQVILAVVGAADPEVQGSFDQSNWDRTHGVGDAVVTRLTDGAVTSVGGVTFDPDNRSNAAEVGGAIIDVTIAAIMLATGCGEEEAWELMEEEESAEVATAEGNQPASSSCGEGAGQCFVAGTPVLDGDGKKETAIQNVKVGDRVATDGGVANSADGKTKATDPNATEVDRKTWRLVKMEVRAVDADGNEDDLQVQELMPLGTLEAEHARKGAVIAAPFDASDIGELTYEAVVESISGCPAIAKGPGRVVLMTMMHERADVRHLTVRDDATGEIETLGVTAGHKLYDKALGWRPVENLKTGDVLRGVHGDVTVVGVTGDARSQAVYNMEVEGDHVYYVGAFGALAHNAGGPEGPCGPITQIPTEDLEVTEGPRSQDYQRQMNKSVAEHGVKEPVKYVEHNGRKYVVDGNHRLRAARANDISSVPARKVELPFRGYRDPGDLFPW